MFLSIRVIVAALLPFAACCQPFHAIAQQPATVPTPSRQSDQRFLGQWVFMVGRRTMMVLDLQPGAGEQPVTGTLTGPKHFQTQDFSSFNHVQGPTRTEKITAAQRKEDALVITVQNPEDAADRPNAQTVRGPKARHIVCDRTSK